MFRATKANVQYTPPAKATLLHTGKTGNYRFTPYTKTVWFYVNLRAMGITLHTPAPTPPAATPHPLHKYL